LDEPVHGHTPELRPVMLARIVLIFALLAGRGVRCAQCALRPPLIVNLYNDVQLGSEVLRSAESEAKWLLSSLCVDVNWSPCRNATLTKPPECEYSGGRMEVHLLSSPLAEARDDTLGLAVVNSNHAAAYVSRIRNVVAANPSLIDLSVLLGYVLAHEIGHVLLHSKAHAKHGVMSGNFGPAELSLMGQLRIKFTEQEQGAVRSQLTAMSKGAGWMRSIPNAQAHGGHADYSGSFFDWRTEECSCRGWLPRKAWASRVAWHSAGCGASPP
jgi:hypothetical protein